MLEKMNYQDIIFLSKNENQHVLNERMEFLVTIIELLRFLNLTLLL